MTFDKNREDFFSEAQEIIETYSQKLLAFDQVLRSGGHDPSLVNEAFRAVHTLKGLAGLFGAAPLSILAHRLEDVLDDLRLGRVEPTSRVLDVLFRAVDVFSELLILEKQESGATLPSADRLLEQIASIRQASTPAQSVFSEFELNPDTLAVLTEYEEHRLRSTIEAGLSLYWLKAKFNVTTLDTSLDDIKGKTTPYGEIITYLPAGDPTDFETIALDILLASRSDLATLVGALGTDNIVVEAVAQRTEKRLSHRARPTSLPRAESLAPPGQSLRASAGDALAPPGAPFRSLSRTVRVDIRKLDHLMNIVGELAMVRTSLKRLAERLRQSGEQKLHTELARIHRPLERRLSELQEAILEVRMVPLSQVFDRLAHVVRRVGQEEGKDVRLVITGAETEIDKLIVEALSDPLMHMVHNACDHGIEPPEGRKAAGKPNAGTIALNAFQKGNHVVIEIEDDGAGIDVERLTERVIGGGHMSASDAALLDREARLALIFLPGISTRLSAGDLSGRGVGMDIVKTNISRLGGVIEVTSELGIGTKLTLTLPITLAIQSALIVRVGDETYAIPLNAVTEAIPLEEGTTRFIEQREVMTLRGETLPLCRLAQLFETPGWNEPRARSFVVVAELRGRSLGFVVDRLIRQEDIVIKALGPSLKDARGFAGATELGDHAVGLVLDVPTLVEEVFSGSDLVRAALLEAHG